MQAREPCCRPGAAQPRAGSTAKGAEPGHACADGHEEAVLPAPTSCPVYRRWRRVLIPREEDLAGDHEALDLGRPLVDLEQLRVAHQLLDGVLLHVPVAAEDLDCVRRDL